MKKLSIILISLFASIVMAIAGYSSVIYKDINSISIRTNFNLDYESIKNDGVPDITFGSDVGGNGASADDYMVYVYDTAKYEIDSCEWYQQGTDEFEIGGSPKVVVYLTTKDCQYDGEYSSNDYYYRFLSSYSASTCYVSKGTFVSATRLSTSSLKVVFALQGLKGTFDPPDNAYWEDNTTGRWDSPNVRDSGYYDLILYKGQSVCARINKVHANNYNFAQYMTKEGDYSFKVRTVAGTDNQAEYGKNSEYTESGAIEIDSAALSAILSGAGQTTTAGGSGSLNVGWIQINNVWHFYRPDGKQVMNGWIQWSGNWYYLDEKGDMKVGMVTLNGRSYYLGSDGAMVAGWINLNDTYYYFDTTSGDNYGAMLINSWIKYDGKYFYFDENGVMVTGWKQINDTAGNVAFYYFYPKGTTQGLYGYMATNTTINGFTIGNDGKWIQK